ncbi:GrpB family protein [Priestia megaterium]|uniref:GrpB family protein n=1 Tax=Priestia megaterium TaxID=1404 RepID=UPI0035E2F57A
MEQVTFKISESFKESSQKAFLIHSKTIAQLLPDADIQHVGSTAIPNCLTKGDLDIQVRVNANNFPLAVRELSKIYDLNEGSINTEYFRAFKNDREIPPLGIQLTVINTEFDIFWKFREVLLHSRIYREEYDSLKKRYEGKSMVEYRKEKNNFFDWLTSTPEFNKL